MGSHGLAIIYDICGAPLGRDPRLFRFENLSEKETPRKETSPLWEKYKQKESALLTCCSIICSSVESRRGLLEWR